MSATCSVIIASTNRPLIVKEAIFSLLEQTFQPIEIVVSVIKEEDFPNPEKEFPPHVRRVISPPGLTTQRNFGFKSLTQKTDFVSYIDDDVILHRDYLKNLSEIFDKREKAVCVMGHLLVNGGITLEEAKALCNSPPEDPNEQKEKYYATSATWGSLYGCNMSFKWEFLEQEKFDERLPLYSEMEDTDMGTRARRAGEVGYYFACVGVHLRTPSGRINYRMHGFSQIMNPYYLTCKGTMPKENIKFYILKRMIVNLTFMFFIQQTKKRFGLLRGNIYALQNILRGKINPELILNLKS